MSVFSIGGVEKSGTWIDDHLSSTDDEGNTNNTENTPTVGAEPTDEDKQNEQAYDDKKDFRDADQEATEKNSLVSRIKELTGWDGLAIIDENNTVILDQNKLAQLGMPGENNGCVFLSTVDGVAKTLGIELTPEQIAQVYKEAKKEGAIGGKNGTYGVNDYDALTQAVATVAKVDNTAKVGTLTSINRNDDKSILETTNTMIDALDNGGSVSIRYDKDPTNPKSRAHTMNVTGASVDNSGSIILHVNDTNHPDTPTFINSTTMTLYTEDDDGRKTPSKRPIVNYRTITKNEETK